MNIKINKYKYMNTFQFFPFRNSFIFAGISVLSACSSPPPEVNASVQLINGSTSSYSIAEVLPEDLWGDLNNAFAGVPIKSSYGLFLIENTYISAMGHRCVAFNLSEIENSTNSNVEDKRLTPKSKYYGQDRRACKQGDTWFLISPLMAPKVSKLSLINKISEVV